MGIYLSTPKTEKFSEDGENDRLRYGLSSMQGWRATMEDAVSNKIIETTARFLYIESHLIINPEFCKVNNCEPLTLQC